MLSSREKHELTLIFTYVLNIVLFYEQNVKKAIYFYIKTLMPIRLTNSLFKEIKSRDDFKNFSDYINTTFYLTEFKQLTKKHPLILQADARSFEIKPLNVKDENKALYY